MSQSEELIFGKRVRLLRKKKGMHLEELARKVGTGRSNLGHIERGQHKPSIDIVVKAADVFKVSTDYLLGRTE